MDDELTGQDLHSALGSLLTDEPQTGFTTGGMLAAGRRTRRRRTVLATGAAGLAVAAITATAVAVPAALGGHPSIGAASPGPDTANPAPHSSTSTRPSARPSAAAPSGAIPRTSGDVVVRAPDCHLSPTNRQWQAHLNYSATVRARLPQVAGTLRNFLTRDQKYCRVDIDTVASWAVSSGSRSGFMSVATDRAPGYYRRWQQHSPCTGETLPCSFTRHGNAWVLVVEQNNGSVDGGNALTVEAYWPDDTVVQVTAQTREPASHRPALTALPLTPAQAVALALDPATRG